MPARARGRPWVADTTDALKDAAARLVARNGFSSLSVEALTKEAGTTRPTFYRRFPSLAYLLLEIVRDAARPLEDVDTGALESDLRAVQRHDVAVFASPLVSHVLVGLVDPVRADGDLRQRYRDELILPRQAALARILDAAVDRGEIDAARADPELVCDMLLGPVLSRVLLPIGALPDDGFARETADVVRRSLAAR